MSTGHMLMGLLAREERHGYDLKHEHDSRFPTARPLAFGQVYATLDRLAKKGFVAGVAASSAEGPDRKVFRLTDEGRSELDQWLTSIDEPAPFVANPLAIKTTIALLVANRSTASDFIDRQRSAHLERMRDLTRRKLEPDVALSDLLALDFAIAHLDADVRWLESALERIAHLEQEIISA